MSPTPAREAASTDRSIVKICDRCRMELPMTAYHKPHHRTCSKCYKSKGKEEEKQPANKEDDSSSPWYTQGFKVLFKKCNKCEQLLKAKDFMAKHHRTCSACYVATTSTKKCPKCGKKGLKPNHKLCYDCHKSKTGKTKVGQPKHVHFSGDLNPGPASRAGGE